MITCSTSNLNNMDKGTPTNYNLVFPLIPSETSIGANNPFVMNIHTAMLPSITLSSEEVRWQGNKTRHGLIPMEYDPWMVGFTVDSLLYNWKLIFDWMSYINNNNDKISESHSRYSVNASLVVTNNYGYPVLEVIFVGIWPSMLQEVAFSQREGDILLESTVNFVYDYYYVKESTWPIEFSSSSQSSSSKSFDSSSSTSESSSSSSSSSSESSSSISSSSSESNCEFDIDDDFEGIPDGEIASVHRWDTIAYDENNRDGSPVTRTDNYPTVSSGTLNWSSEHVVDGEHLERYRLMGNTCLPYMAETPNDCWVLEMTISGADEWYAIGANREGAELSFGVSTVSTDNGYRIYGQARNGLNISYEWEGGTSNGGSLLPIADHFPLKLRIKRKLNPDGETTKTGFKYYDRVQDKWVGYLGTTEGYFWEAQDRLETARYYPYIEFNMVVDDDTGSKLKNVSVDNFVMLSGATPSGCCAQSSSSSSTSSSSSSSSTSVYASIIRWSEYDKGEDIKIDEFGIVAKNINPAGADNTVIATDGASSGKVYFEVKCVNAGATQCQIGWCKKLGYTQDYDYQFELGQNTQGVGMSIFSTTSYIYYDGVIQHTINGHDLIKRNDVVGCAANIDSGRYWWRIGNTWYPDSPVSGSGIQLVALASPNTIYPAMGLEYTGQNLNNWEILGNEVEYTYAPPAGFTYIQASKQEERTFLTMLDSPRSSAASFYASTNKFTMFKGTVPYGARSAAIADITKNTGKWYFEGLLDDGTNDYLGIGWSSLLSPEVKLMDVNAGENTGDLGVSWNSYGRQVYHNGSQVESNYGMQGVFPTNLFACAIDIDAGKVWFGSDYEDGTGIIGEMKWFDGFTSNDGDPANNIGGLEYPAMAGQTLVPWISQNGYGDAVQSVIRFHPTELRYAPPSGFSVLDSDYDDYYGWDENNKSSQVTISGARVIKTTNSGILLENHGVFGKLAKGEGSKYVEFKINSVITNAYFQFGLTTDTHSVSAVTYSNQRRGMIVKPSAGIKRVYWGVGSNDFDFHLFMNIANDDVFGLAVDFRTGDYWFHRNGVWYDASNGYTGDPANGVNPFGNIDKIYKLKPFVSSRDDFDVTLRIKDNEYQYKPAGFTEW